MIVRDGEPSVQDALNAFPEERPSKQRGVAVKGTDEARERSRDSLFEFVPAGPPVDLAATGLHASTRHRRHRRSRLLVAVLRGTQAVTRTIVVGASRGLAYARRGVMRGTQAVTRAIVVVPSRGLVYALRGVMRGTQAVTRAIVVGASRGLTYAWRGVMRGTQAVTRAIVVVPSRGLAYAWRGVIQGTQAVTRTIVVGTARELAHARCSVKTRVFPMMSAAAVLVPNRPPLSSSVAVGFTVLIVVIVASLAIPRETTRSLLPAHMIASWAPLAVPAIVSIERPLFAAVQGDESVRSKVRTPAATRAPQREDTMTVQRALNRYRDAFSVLDAAAVKTVWPSVDEEALRKTFAGFYDQNVEFDTCRISVTAATANALCQGNVSYVRSRNTKQRRHERRQWQFTLVNDGTRWIIRTVDDGSDLVSKAEPRETVATKENDSTYN